MRPLLAVAMTALLLTGVDVRPAAACSCLGGPLAERVADDGVVAAVVGAVVEVGVVEDPAGDAVRTYTIEVEEVARDVVGPRVLVRAHVPDGANCGVAAEVGDRVGWLLRRDEGVLVTSSCDGADPDELAALPGTRPVAAPSPDPGDPPGLDESPLFPIGGALLAVGALLGAVVWLDRR